MIGVIRSRKPVSSQDAAGAAARETARFHWHRIQSGGRGGWVDGCPHPHLPRSPSVTSRPAGLSAEAEPLHGRAAPPLLASWNPLLPSDLHVRSTSYTSERGRGLGGE